MCVRYEHQAGKTFAFWLVKGCLADEISILESISSRFAFTVDICGSLFSVSFTHTVFQSTPLVITRGDHVLKIKISRNFQFQSTPLVITRGDRLMQTLGTEWGRFNPRPS